MKEVLKVIKRIQNTNSRNDKEEIIRVNKNNEQFKNILYHVFNTYVVFGIKDKKLNKFMKTVKGSNSKFNNINEVFEYLKVNNTGSDVVVKEVAEFLNNEQDEEMRKLMYECITKKLKIGANIKSINKAFGEKFIPEFNVQLAKKFEDEQHKVEGKEFTLTEKLDGMRVLAIVEDGNVKFFSRQGQPVLELVEIGEEIKQLPNNVYDGELLIANADEYKDRDVLQETLKICRRDGKKKNLILHLFDVISIDEFHNGKSNKKYNSRRKELENIIRKHDFKFVKVLPVLYKGKDMSVIPNLLDKMNSQSKEGLMLNTDDYYETKRTDSLLKIKTMNTVDLRIIGFEEGEGKYEGVLGALILDYKGYDLRCGSGLTDLDREHIWNNRDKYLGKIVEVQYFRESKSQDGNLSVSFPIFKQIRLDKNEPSYY